MLNVLATCAVLSAAAIELPGGPPVGMDYLAYDSANHRIWVPAGNTGSVDVVDTTKRKIVRLDGFPTSPSPRPGRPNMGPSSVAVGEKEVWVGNRGDNKLCSFDRRTLKRRTCLQLGSMPDGLAYVAATDELWVTTPRDKSIAIFDVKGKPPAVPTFINLPGSPEGYAVDEMRSVFYTNLEDKDKTLAIDIKTHKVAATWSPGCGAEGPRGLSLDSARRLLFVACTNGVVTLDLAREGKVVSHLKTGAGVDNIDYFPPRSLLYIASAKDATLTIARVGDEGSLTAIAAMPTAEGARNPVVDGTGTAYVADSHGGQLIVIQPPAH
jgi:DNA-binding beta-propeller fold protein YncE